MLFLFAVITSVTRPVPNPLYSGVSFVANASSCVVEQGRDLLCQCVWLAAC